ncbi:hypothetical protein P12x_001139 [Tundrisphaera lichenicola]|uniref:hypothetical protein n=1 Tax=Tundrisphaera lichenicola TaxID=2029860 RepID=UPI003EBD6805
MSEQSKLIPSPPVVRERLARNVREARLLRALLRLAIKANQEQCHFRDLGANTTARRSERGGQ